MLQASSVVSVRIPRQLQLWRDSRGADSDGDDGDDDGGMGASNSLAAWGGGSGGSLLWGGPEWSRDFGLRLHVRRLNLVCNV